MYNPSFARCLEQPKHNVDDNFADSFQAVNNPDEHMYDLPARQPS